MNYHLIGDRSASMPGAHRTDVCSRHCGLAPILIGDKPHDHTTVVHDAGCQHRISAREPAELSRSDNPREAGIGVAAINALPEMEEKMRSRSARPKFR
jgi:hypothetical protein